MRQWGSTASLATKESWEQVAVSCYRCTGANNTSCKRVNRFGYTDTLQLQRACLTHVKPVSCVIGPQRLPLSHLPCLAPTHTNAQLAGENLTQTPPPPTGRPHPASAPPSPLSLRAGQRETRQPPTKATACAEPILPCVGLPRSLSERKRVHFCPRPALEPVRAPFLHLCVTQRKPRVTRTLQHLCIESCHRQLSSPST